MRPDKWLYILPLLFTAGASAQSIPFTITNFSLPINGVNNTYSTTLASMPGGTAVISGAGLSNQSATVTATGTASRERGLLCGGAIELAITFTFTSANSISVLASGPLSKNNTTATLSFSVTGGL